MSFVSRARYLECFKTPLVFQVHASSISSMRRSLVQEVVWKTTQTWLGGKSCFSHTNPSNFRLPLQSLLLRYRAQIYRWPNFNMIFQLVQTQFFKSELFSCLPKDDHVINWCKRLISSSSRGSELCKSEIKFPASRALFLAFYLVRVVRVADTHVAWLVYVCTYCVPIATSNRNKGSRVLYLGDARIMGFPV